MSSSIAQRQRQRQRQRGALYSRLLLGGLCFSAGSYGQTPPAANYSASVAVQEGSNAGFTDLNSIISTAGSVGVGPGCINVVGGGCGSASASVSSTLGVSVSGSTTATSYELPQAVAGSAVTIYYYVMGPAGQAAGTSVPMIFSGNFSGSASGAQSYVEAGVQLSSTAGAIGTSGCATGYSTSTCTSSFSAPFLFNSSSGFSVFSSSAATDSYYLNDVSLSLTGVAPIAGTFSAQIDPVLELDPSAVAAGYTLVFGEGYSVPLSTYSAGQLTIPTVSIGSAIYSNMLITVGGLVSGPTGTAPNGIGVTYNPASNELTIPAGMVGTTIDYNVVVTVDKLVSIGSVTGADSYDLSSGVLTIASVVYQNTLYTDVVVKDVSIADVVLPIVGGMPKAGHDEYDYADKLLTIPAVQVVGVGVFTNVLVRITPSQVVSISGIPL